MITKILGLADLLAVLSLILVQYLPGSIVTFIAFYLMIKGVLFFFLGSIMSLLDAACGLYLIIAYSGYVFWPISIIFILFIGQKGVISLLS